MALFRVRLYKEYILVGIIPRAGVANTIFYHQLIGDIIIVLVDDAVVTIPIA